jgi:hypothetical protein
MFDLTKEPSWPDWHHNIFRYAKRVLMYCDLSRHHNTTYVNAHHSPLFLHGLQGCWKDMGVLYILLILTHQQLMGKSIPLPNHLQILPLAQTLAELN